MSTRHSRVSCCPFITSHDGRLSIWMLLMVKAEAKQKDGRHCYFRNSIAQRHGPRHTPHTYTHIPHHTHIHHTHIHTHYVHHTHPFSTIVLLVYFFPATQASTAPLITPSILLPQESPTGCSLYSDCSFSRLPRASHPGRLQACAHGSAFSVRMSLVQLPHFTAQSYP